LFLVGLPRSGTTFLQRVLDAHPRILLTDETAVFLQLADLVTRSRRGVVEGIYFGKSHGELWAEILRRHAKNLFHEFYASIAKKENKKNLAYWGDKHPHYCNCMDFLLELYPDAVFLLSLRDPRDVACSLAKVKGISLRQAISDTEIFLSLYLDFFQRHSEAVPFTIHYEKLVADPHRVCGEILAFLDLALTPEVERALETWRVRDAHAAPEGQEPRDFRNNTGNWQKLFSAEDLAVADATFAPYQSLYGNGLLETPYELCVERAD